MYFPRRKWYGNKCVQGIQERTLERELYFLRMAKLTLLKGDAK
jgi:hypothetical protein